MCGSMVDSQSAITEIRRGKKTEDRRRRRKKPRDKNITGVWLPVLFMAALHSRCGSAMLCRVAIKSAGSHTPASQQITWMNECRVRMLPRCADCIMRFGQLTGHFVTELQTRMWANAQPNGRPAEYRWRPVLNAAKFGSRPLLDCRAVMLRIGEHKTWGRKVNFAPGKILLWSNSSRKCIYSPPAQARAKHCAKFGWLPLSDITAVTKPGRKNRRN